MLVCESHITEYTDLLSEICFMRSCLICIRMVHVLKYTTDVFHQFICFCK